MMNTNTPEFGDRFETFVPANKKDSKGRSLGFIVILVDNGVDFHACVQKAILKNGEPVAWGASQRSKKFKSQKEATSYAYATAKARIANLA